MNKKSYVLGLFSTLAIFSAVVYFALVPKYGPQISINQSDSTVTPTPEIINEDILQPNYGDVPEEQQVFIDKAIGNLLNSEEGITPGMISVESFEEEEFSDASLGCPEPGSSYAQVVTPGFKVMLSANDVVYDYRVAKDSDIVVLCSQ